MIPLLSAWQEGSRHINEPIAASSEAAVDNSYKISMVYIIRTSAYTVKGHDKKSYKILESARKTGYHTKLFPLRMTARLLSRE